MMEKYENHDDGEIWKSWWWRNMKIMMMEKYENHDDGNAQSLSPASLRLFSSCSICVDTDTLHTIWWNSSVVLHFVIKLCQCNHQVDDDDEDDNDDEDDHDAADDDPERQQFLPKARLVYNQAGVQGSSSRASISRAEPFQNIQPQSLEGQNILQRAWKTVAQPLSGQVVLQ